MIQRIRRRCAILGISVSILLIIYLTSTSKEWHKKEIKNLTSLEDDDYNVWLIFTKVYEGSPLKYKFTDLLKNLLNVSSVTINFNIIVDNTSVKMAEKILFNQMKDSKKNITYNLYNIDVSAKKIEDIVGVLSNYFSKPGSYYSDILFYISLGLHRIAPEHHKRAILLDCDVYFKKDVILLFNEFDKFKKTALFGLAPELSPVYRHVLRVYRSKNNQTKFGEYYHWNQSIDRSMAHSRGFQGYNSGVLLLKLDLIRKSDEFNNLFRKDVLDELTKKYYFKQGHLGDQDFYTLIGCEYPHLIQTLNCGFNKQLCTWWRDNGYKDIFDKYARCDHEIVVLHGNCNTRIPK